ncbi:uncharacterized protein A4U43_C07F32310 [Asparagus officinalis]|uniref:Small ribosomal subunit protein mS38 n=1 Tax=Asparagus officinalis TaxID=4686 RepID=A0A5P1ELR8_ASPOF|nr:uncharacterized protein A4U43_C07F32310 [Asparagus officinalis]
MTMEVAATETPEIVTLSSEEAATMEVAATETPEIVTLSSEEAATPTSASTTTEVTEEKTKATDRLGLYDTNMGSNDDHGDGGGPAMWADNVKRKKRKRKMNKHKLKKLRKRLRRKA